MSIYRFALRVCAITILFALIATSGVYAVEQWSTDIWKDPIPSPSTNESNTSTQQKGNSSGGLWSEELWKSTPTVQPIPKPTDKPLPVKNPDETQYLLVMQVANNKAVVNGVNKELSVPPTIINGRMMVPLKFTGDALKASYTWSNADRKATMVLDDKKIEVWARKSTAMVNGKVVQLDTPPVVLDDSLLVPIGFIIDNFGYPIDYEGVTKTIKLRKPEETGARPKPQPLPPAEEIVKPSPDKDKVEGETKKPVIDSTFNYFGVWSLRMDGFSGGLPLGTLIVQEDGSYGIKHSISGTITGKWRQGKNNEVIGYKDMLILENGPGGIDWVMIPKADGIVSIRYHYGYSGQNKIWFEDCLGIQLEK